MHSVKSSLFSKEGSCFKRSKHCVPYLYWQSKGTTCLLSSMSLKDLDQFMTVSTARSAFDERAHISDKSCVVRFHWRIGWRLAEHVIN